MSTPIPLGLSAALVLSALAALSDLRSGTIPNWLTLPPIVLAPFAYAASHGIGGAVQAVTAAVLSGAVPYLLFAWGGMGGGDVKLFAALGALTSFDIRIGLEIQICAFVCAMCLAIARSIWAGELRSTMSSAIEHVLRATRLRRPGCRGAKSMTPHRLGMAILVSTLLQCGPQVADAWSRR